MDEAAQEVDTAPPVAEDEDVPKYPVREPVGGTVVEKALGDGAMSACVAGASREWFEKCVVCV